MSQLIEVLARIDDAGGRVLVQDGQVSIRTPAGLLSDQDRAVLAQHREELRSMFERDEDQQPEDPVVVDPIPCERCGGAALDLWQSLTGTLRCLRHDPPFRAQRFREAAARIRNRSYTRGGKA